jgi:hypothetical protein
MTFENISFTFNSNLLVLIPLLFLVFAYTYFVYRFTIPTTSFFVKAFLFSLRSISLLLIITILFEPSLSLNYSIVEKPHNVLFMDNSTSIVNKDSLKRSEYVHKFISDFKNNTEGNVNFFTFGKEVTKRVIGDNFKLNFEEEATNFDNITNSLKSKENISSVTIISDGIINDGSNSYSTFEKLGIPIYTVAIGDTTEPSDISIKKVSFNKLIYINKETEIKSRIKNSKLAGKKVFVTLRNRSGILEKKQILLNENGLNNVSFSYTPTLLGKQRLKIAVSQLSEEESLENNNYPFVLDVLNDKIKVLLLAGAPSADLSTLTQSLLRNDNIKLNKIIQISRNRFLDESNFETKLDSADIIVMIDFPSTNTPNKLLDNVKDLLQNKKTPFFIVLSQSLDYQKLSIFGKQLTFLVERVSKERISTQININSNNNVLIKNLNGWEKLSPIYTNTTLLKLKSGTTLIASGVNRNSGFQFPLIFSSKIASSRSIVLNGINFWKWRLQSDNSVNNLFNGFIANSVKWLYANNNQKRIFVNSTKEIYNSNEEIEFSGNIFDESLTPRSDAVITVKIKGENFEKSLKLSSIKDGKYEGKINISQPGDYNFVADISIPGEQNSRVNGKFSILKVNIENNNFVLNSNYLMFISNITSGKSFDINNYSNLFEEINRLSKLQTKKKIVETKYDIWTNEWTLVLIILLFAIEWFIRKRKGML